MRRAAKNRRGGQGIQYLVSLQWRVVQLDFSDGMHMTENSYMPQSARMRAQIQANTGDFVLQRFSLHGVDLTKFDGGAGGARDVEVIPSIPQPRQYSKYARDRRGLAAQYCKSNVVVVHVSLGLKQVWRMYWTRWLGLPDIAH